MAYGKNGGWGSGGHGYGWLWRSFKLKRYEEIGLQLRSANIVLKMGHKWMYGWMNQSINQSINCWCLRWSPKLIAWCCVHPANSPLASWSLHSALFGIDLSKTQFILKCPHGKTAINFPFRIGAISRCFPDDPGGSVKALPREPWYFPCPAG